MNPDSQIDKSLLVQPLEPGTTIPSDFPPAGMFVLNLVPILANDVWDDYGNKEQDQASRLRSLANRILAIADSMEELGKSLKGYPDAGDYETDDYEQSWDEICSEMDSTFTCGYLDLKVLVDELAEAAVGDFMD
jgi:hypothetical protein